MRFLSATYRAKTAGFTLIEVLIIAPIVILVISGFIALIITMVGDVLATRDRNAMTFEIRDSLDRIEQDTRLSTQFLTTTVNIQAPQGSDDGTTPFSNTNSLILGALTTDKNPVDSSRQIVFYAKQPNDCGAQQAYNRPFVGKIIYFLKNGSLWRRTYLLPYNTSAPADDETLCSSPWQQNSCSPGYLPSTRCQTNDVELMRNVDTFTVKYYTSPQSTTEIGATNALSAGSIEITLTGKKSVAGRSLNQSGSVRVAKLNNIDADLPLPAAPTLNVTSSNANGAVFSWPTVPSATSYLISYNINGGSWTNLTKDSATLNYTVAANRQDTVTFKIAAKNSTGTSAYTTTAFTIPDWNTCNLGGSWVDYGFGYTTAGFTKTTANVVQLKGLIKNGSVAPGTTICILPPGFRPTATLMFQAATNPSNTTRIDVQPSGEVFLGDTNTSTTWVDLSEIRFVASTASYTPVAPTFANNWVNYDGGVQYSTLQLRKDSLNRVHSQGLIKNGTMTDNFPFANLPVGYRPSEYYHFPARSNAPFNFMGISSTDMLYKFINTPGANAFYSPQSMYYASGAGSWTNLALLAGWQNYGGIYTVPQYTKASDGIVTVKGLIKNGTTTGNPVIANLPPGYRPKERIVLHVVANGAYGRIDINTNGDMIALTSNATWTALDGIHFMAEQ